MAVFWFGWAKKLKNIFTKQQADQYYLQKELPNQLQIVKGNVDFYKNVVIKQNGYVDNVDTNAPTAMINKRYFEEQLTKLQPAIIYDSGSGTLFQNLATINLNLQSSNYSQWDLNKPIYVSFVRFKSNGSVFSKYTGILSFWDIERAVPQFIGTNLYVGNPNNSNPNNNNNIISGQASGILFRYNQQATIICPDNNELIGGITLMGYKK